MRKSRAINLVLFIMIVALGLIVWLDPFPPETPKYSPLTAIDPADVVKISLLKSGNTAFSVTKQIGDSSSGWQISEPLQIPANPLKINQLLNLLNTNSLRQYRIKSNNLAKLGLARPAWEIVFQTKVMPPSGQSSQGAQDSNTITIGFGKTEPVEQKRYVLVNNTVHLINDRVSQFNFGTPLMLANLDILPVDKSVKEVHLPNKVIRRVDGQWQSSSPSERNMSQSAYKKFIDEWRYAQASRVALADNSEITSDATPVTVVLEKAEQPVHFMVESSGQDFIVTNKDWGVRYYLTGGAGEKLLHLDKPAQE